MIDGTILKKAIISGAENICRYVEDVDRLNVFPVPDGDTGTNLSLTLNGCANAIADYEDTHAGRFADKVASALFRSARGNSGVIFSLMFKGFANSVKESESIDATALAKGLEDACNEAYSSIEKPTEGTILTVIRLAASKAIAAAESGKSAEETYLAALNGAKASLKSTPNLLPTLKKHGVVDAGGQGLVYIMEGMLGCTDKISDTEAHKPNKPKTENAEIPFAYCTEFLINNPKDYNISSLRKYFSDIGDCTAVAEHSGIIKIHIHTNSPHKALEKGIETGELTDIKIDNMKYQANSL